MANQQNINKYKFGKNAANMQRERAIQSKGGVAAAVKKKEKKAAKEIVKAFFDENIKTSEGHQITRKQLMILNALERINNSIMLSNKNTALTNEELKCLDYALQLIGEAPVPKTQQEVSINTPINIIDDIDTKPEGKD